MTFQLTSPNFQTQGQIPMQFTCEGDDLSPELTWSGAPDGTQSFVLIVDDPDAPDPAAPKMTWVHWLLYNLPPQATHLPQGVTRTGLPSGTLQGINDWKRTGYGGPCPPIGRHRYYFKLYALNTVLPDLHSPAKPRLEAALQPHILGEAVLMGTYQKQARS